MYTVITENDVSQWDDKTGSSYHFPSRYLKLLKPGTKVIYYKGRQTDKKFKNLRLSKDPHYFALAEIGEITQEKNTTNYYADIVGFRMFIKAVPFKINGEPFEEIPESLKKNYWRDGVRLINDSIYNKIISIANIELSDGNLNDQKDTEFNTVIIEGGKKKVFTTKYERKKESRDQALHIHGYTCQVCKFNFKDVYGDWGEGYIHVHHLKPLSTNDSEVEINPKTDLSVVCANCHSMIHRRKNILLSLEDLKKKLKRK
ncbi:MAG TPA: HNH endonuclease [Ignavibacteriaceae bacterium]